MGTCFPVVCGKNAMNSVDGGGTKGTVSGGKKSGGVGGEKKAMTTTFDDSFTAGYTGKKFSHYTMKDLIGCGSQAEVWKCSSSNIEGQYFACKVIKKRRAMIRKKKNKKSSRRNKKRAAKGKYGKASGKVRKEIAIMKQLRHDHVVNLFDILDDPNQHFLYLVLEYMPGGPLSTHDSGIIDPPIRDVNLARSYFQQLVLGLEYLHHHDVFHRDIKPSNLLLSQDKKILKIADFGVSEFLHDHNDSHQGLRGTIAFIAPETFGVESFHAAPVDIWAAGVTFYSMLYGDLPFGGRGGRGGDGEGGSGDSGGPKGANTTGTTTTTATTLEEVAKEGRQERPMSEKKIDDDDDDDDLSSEVVQVSLPISTKNSVEDIRAFDTTAAIPTTLHSVLSSSSSSSCSSSPGSTQEEMEAQICAGRLTFPHRKYRGAEDMLLKIFVLDPTRRATLGDLKRHRWLRQGDWKSNTPKLSAKHKRKISVTTQDIANAVRRPSGKYASKDGEEKTDGLATIAESSEREAKKEAVSRDDDGEKETATSDANKRSSAIELTSTKAL
eukprot:g3044.t1